MKHRRVSLEIVGEIFLLAVVASLFAYFLVQSFRWPFGSALMPRIAVAIGIPFLIARVVILVRRTALEQGSIMDMGFRLGEDPESEKKNFVRICGFIVGLYLAIWVFGFHVALPLGMFLYLFFYGRAGWFVSTVVALSFLATIVGIYDNVLHISWHEPLIFRLLR